MAKAIQLKRVAKGDLVVGHRVYAFMPDGLPAVPGIIVEATDRAVVMQIDGFLAALGLPRKSRWTWRRSAGSYQQAGARTRKEVGLALDPRPKPARSPSSEGGKS